MSKKIFVTEVLRIAGNAAAIGQGCVCKSVDGIAAVCAEGDEDLGNLRGVGDLSRGERREEVVHEQHRVDVTVVDDEAGCVLIGELGIEGVAQGRPEFD